MILLISDCVENTVVKNLKVNTRRFGVVRGQVVPNSDISFECDTVVIERVTVLADRDLG